MLLHACLLTCACKSRELRGATRHRRVEGAAAAPSADPVMDAANAAWERALERGQAPLTTAESRSPRARTASHSATAEPHAAAAQPHTQPHLAAVQPHTEPHTVAAHGVPQPPYTEPHSRLTCHLTTDPHTGTAYCLLSS